MTTTPRWYARPEGVGKVLQLPPRLASWNKASDPDQERLREYLEATEAILESDLVTCEPWALVLDVGLPAGSDLLNKADLDNYAYPLAYRLRNEHLVSVWCTKGYSENSSVLIGPARETTAPGHSYVVRTTASAETTAYKEQVRSAVPNDARLPAGPVQLHIAFAVGSRRNWLNLWKPTIDALDPLLGRTREDRDWHPQDGRITELALHVDVDPALKHDVVLSIAAAPEPAASSVQ